MRYYSIVISDPASGQVWQPSATGAGFIKAAGGTTFTSFVNGKNNPAALNIEFDLPITSFATPQGGNWLRVWGVGLGMIGQAANLNNQSIQLLAGMQRGLPLATAALNNKQTGIILQGQIFQAFGNWQGVNQTLDLICQGAPLPPTNGIAFNWTRGQPLSSAIAASLQQAFPAYTYNINISNSLFTPNGATQAGSYPSLETFAQYLRDISQPLGAQFAGENYSGVQITMRGQTIYVLDSTSTPKKTVQLIFQDLIGQPTWIDATSVSFKTVLRADIGVGDHVIFPKGIIAPYVLTTTEAAVPNAPSRSKSAFQGTFAITEVHHFANFRQPDADSWCTAFVAVVTS
jgi:hypothetical protein